MKSNSPKSDDLHDIIDGKVTAMMREMQDASWSTDDVALAMHEVLQRRWLSKIEPLGNVRAAVRGNFVSDGNEG
jgi:hypothetical protein